MEEFGTAGARRHTSLLPSIQYDNKKVMAKWNIVDVKHQVHGQKNA